ncbi:MAG TPA: IS701 family transposase [Nostocaceae cyanobacterium]|nr:IS701 family transposase [Nostocaceae cyanobacterium]
MTLPRTAKKTVCFLDEYCEAFKDIFPEVRSFESFKNLLLGIISEEKRKTLPAIAKVTGLKNAQSLHHFISNSPWSTQEFQNRRLEILSNALKGEKFILIIDDTGDRRKGKTTEYIARQYIGNLGKVDQGIVSVNAYGIVDEVTFPLLFKIYKPQQQLAPGDKYKSKPELAGEIISELRNKGWNFQVILADSFYGESSKFRQVLNDYNLQYALAIRSNHKFCIPDNQQDAATEWQEFDRKFTNGNTETRYIREISLGEQNEEIRYWVTTTDKDKLPKVSTTYIMTNLPGDILQEVGNIYGLRTWIEYGFKQIKNELGWADYRFTDYPNIQRWWEIVFTAYTMISLQSETFINFAAQSEPINSPSVMDNFQQHPHWQPHISWKSILNNLRLIIQPSIFLSLLTPWLSVFRLPSLYYTLLKLIDFMNHFHAYVPSG